MFAEDAAIFLADYGQPTTWAPAGRPEITGLMLLDQPDTEVDGSQVTSREYEATFATANWPGLQRGQVLTIAGAAYKLRTDPRQLDDGVFGVVRLSRV